MEQLSAARHCPPRRARALAVALLLGAAAPTMASAQSSKVDLVIATTTDVHGRLRAWDYYAGAPDSAHSLAAAATIVDSVRAAHPGRVVLVEAGDILQGNPLTYVAARVSPPPVHPVIASMNVMRYDAAVLGNHEFNYGVPLLRRAMAQASFPFLAANVQNANGSNFAVPWTMVTRAGIKVAIVGGTTPGSMVWDRDNLGQAGVTVSDIVPAVKTSVAAARRAKADVVVVLLHSGLAEPATYDTLATGLPSENVSARIPKEIPGVDVVVFGHSHREVVDTTIGGALVMQARNWAGSVGLGTLSMEKVKGKWTVASRRGERVLVTKHKESPAVLAASARTHETTRTWVQGTVGQTSVAWRADSARVADVPLMDLVAEVMRRETKADLAAVSAFSLDASLPAGGITRAMISRLYPYDNTLRAVRITGAQLRAYLEYSARYYRTLTPSGDAPSNGIVDQAVAGYNFDIIAGADYVLDLRQPIGQRVTRLQYRGRDVVPTDSFTLAVNNYRQSGGGGYAMLANAPVVYQRDTEIRQLIIDEIERTKTIEPARYFTANWSIEPTAARELILREQLRGRRAEAGGRSSASTVVGTPGQRMLRVIAMSDFHAQLKPRFDGANPMGGAVALSAALRKAQGECVAPACESVIIDAGDLFTGTPASDWDSGRPTVGVVNRFDIAAGALGNHEFDFSQDTLKVRMRELRHAVLGANVRGPDGKLPSWIRADTIVQRGNVRIGIVGAAGTHTSSSAARRKIAGLTFIDPLPVYQERAKALRAAGAQMIIFVVHDGGRCDRDRPTVCEGDGIALGKRVAALGAERPDVYVMGHAHVNLTFDFDGMPAVEPTSSGRGIVVVDLPIGGGAARAEIRPVRGEAVEGAEASVDSIVNVATARSEAKEKQLVATIASDMRRRGNQYPLGNLIADAARTMGAGDVGMINNGGIRIDVRAGPLMFGGVHLISPFGNVLTRMRVRGRDLKPMMERTFEKSVPNAHVSGLLIEYDSTRAQGDRIVRLTTANGAAIEPDRIYAVVMNDFMIDDLYSDLQKTAVSTEYLPLRDSDALAEYLRRQPQPVQPDTTVRIRPVAAGAR